MRYMFCRGTCFFGSLMIVALMYFLLGSIGPFAMAMDQEQSDEVVQVSDEDISESQASHDTDEDDDSQQDIERPRPKNILPLPVNIVEKKAKGVTLKEAFDFLYEHQKMQAWGACKVISWLWGLTAGSCFMFGIPGWTTAGLYCRNYAGIMQCLSSCKKAYDLARDIPSYSQCQGHCYNQDIQTLDNPYCHVGLTLSFVPALFFIAATCAVPITKAQHAFVKSYNQSIQRALRWHFLKARTFEHELTKEDVRYIAVMMLENNAAFMVKLTPYQALGIAEANWPAFVKLADEGFSRPTQALAQKLIELYNAPDKPELFSSPKTKTLLSKNPLLLETLMRILPLEELHDEGIKKSLIKILEDILPNTTISQDIYESIAIATPIAHFTSSSAHEPPSHETATRDRKGQNADWANLLTMYQNDEDIVIDKHNITTVLGAASHFKITALLQKCDLFIVENRLSHALLLMPYSRTNSTPKHLENLTHMLSIAKQFGLKKTYHSLAADIVQELNNLTIKNPGVLEKLGLLEDQDIEDVAHFVQRDLFTKKLTDHQFLHWIWPQAKDIGLLRDLILEFCHNPKNAPIMNEAWDLVPVDLQEALDETTST